MTRKVGRGVRFRYRPSPKTFKSIFCAVPRCGNRCGAAQKRKDNGLCAFHLGLGVKRSDSSDGFAEVLQMRDRTLAAAYGWEATTQEARLRVLIADKRAAMKREQLNRRQVPSRTGDRTSKQTGGGR